jgi:glutamine amidotransferase
MVVIIDYGMGNLRSVVHKLFKAGIPATLSARLEDIERAEKLILPGVGAFAAGMENLAAAGLIPMLQDKVLRKKTPIFGICLGMQLFARSSEEGDVPGLGWIDGEVKRFRFAEGSPLRVPHVGWNGLRCRRESPLLTGIAGDQRFYFTHSYHMQCQDNVNIIATTTYGYDFVSIVQHENICGVQFHPEKSHRRGIEIVKNFVRYLQ